MLNEIRIIIHTAKGDIDATLFPDKAPVTTANFLNLAARKFYDGLSFHRVVPGFVVQGGDPLGTGAGDPGFHVENEIDPSLSHKTVGVVAMANAGPDTNGSQFYITLEPLHPGHVEKLDGNYSIFGQVNKGMEVARKLSKGDKIQSIDILDPVDSLFAKYKARLAEWNKVLDQRFGSRLGPGPAIP